MAAAVISRSLFVGVRCIARPRANCRRSCRSAVPFSIRLLILRYRATAVRTGPLVISPFAVRRAMTTCLTAVAGNSAYSSSHVLRYSVRIAINFRHRDVGLLLSAAISRLRRVRLTSLQAIRITAVYFASWSPRSRWGGGVRYRRAARHLFCRAGATMVTCMGRVCLSASTVLRRRTGSCCRLPR